MLMSGLPQEHVRKFGHLAAAHLAPAEQLLDVVPVVPLRGAHVVGAQGLVKEAGSALAQLGAVKGGQGSIAEAFPHPLPQAATRLLCVTDQRLLLLVSTPARKSAELAWQLPRSLLTRIERRLRLQLLAKFRLHFADGSSVSILTTRRRNVESLARALGVS